MDLELLIGEHFSEPQKCYGHCEKQARLKFISKDDTLLAGYVCPSGYLSRLMLYGETIDAASLKTYLRSSLRGLDVTDDDIRLATRYSWDLGLSSARGKVMQVAYWTQNYRRTKSESPDRTAFFLCSSCNSLFSQPVEAGETLCPVCRSP